MEKIAVFPGSFDPITVGHVDIVMRALPFFDKIIVAVGVNDQKKTLFPLPDRLKWLDQVFRDEPKIEIGSFENLTAHYCSRIGAKYLIRGLRNASDFDYEKPFLNLIISLGMVLKPFF